MTDYLVFVTQQDAAVAAETIYANMIKGVDSPDLLNVDTGQVVDKDVLTNQEVVQVNSEDRYYPVFGKNAASGVKEEKSGYTTAWANVQETLQGKWVFPKPADVWMNGVINYTVEPYDPNWFPQNN